MRWFKNTPDFLGENRGYFLTQRKNHLFRWFFLDQAFSSFRSKYYFFYFVPFFVPVASLTSIEF
jgi:hypothetical protein